MWTHVAASVRGTSHAATGLRLQDAHRCFAANDFLVAIACDGAGSASHGGEGAVLAARHISSMALAYVRVHDRLPADDVLETWIDEARDLIWQAASRRGLAPRDFATTVVMAIASADAILSAHIGDGAVVAMKADEPVWRSVSWPEQGEYASTTYFLTDEQEPRLRVSQLNGPFRAIAVMTDGIERLALDFALPAPHGPFLDGMIAPLAGANEGRDLTLSTSLASYLASPAVNARTDDDKTLVLALRQ